MNRRSFIRNSALALFGFTVLPPATTYDRVWRVTKEVQYDVQYCCIMAPPSDQAMFISSFFFGEKAIDPLKVAPVSEQILQYKYPDIDRLHRILATTSNA